MAGVKGRSGRKTRVTENSRAEVIMQSWDVLKRFFADNKISLIKKADIASRIAIKDFPNASLNIQFTFKDLVERMNGATTQVNRVANVN